jgi:hypothetical protein
MATIADVLAKYNTYKAKLDNEAVAYTNSATLAGFAVFYQSTHPSYTYTAPNYRPTIDPEAPIDTFNVQKAARDDWDKAFKQAQADYTNAVHDRRLAEVDLVGILPPNQWIQVDPATYPAGVWIGYRPAPPATPGYPMIRSVSGTSPGATLFTDISLSTITANYTTYLASIATVGTKQTAVDGFYVPGSSPPVLARPAAPDYIPQPGVGTPDGDYHSIFNAQATWDNDFANSQYELAYALIDQRNSELALMLNMPPDLWVQVTLPAPAPVVWIGYNSGDATPSLRTVPTAPTHPFPNI